MTTGRREDVLASPGARPRAPGTPFALFALLAVALATASADASIGCAPVADSAAGPRVCKKDSDCGHGQYCTEASLCRTDCFVDRDCIGPYPDAQCNAQGRCVQPADASAPVDAGPSSDAIADGAGASGDGGGP